MWPRLTKELSLALFVPIAHALPAAFTPVLEARQAITSLTSTQISAFKPYSHYASAGYCAPAATLAWNCGANCQANPTFKPVASGGDGSSVQFCTNQTGSFRYGFESDV